MGKLILQDKVFKLGVRKVNGVIHAEQGIIMFYNEAEHIFCPYPYPTTADDYEQETALYMRSSSNTVVRNPTQDDCLVGKLRANWIDVCTSKQMLEDQLESEKIQRVPTAMKFFGVAAIGVISLLVLVVLAALNILRMWLLFIPVVVFLIAGFSGATYFSKLLGKNVLYDKRGNWVDVASGDTNLGDGSNLIASGCWEELR